MATAAVIGLGAGKRLLNSSYFYSDVNEKLYYSNSSDLHRHIISSRSLIIAAGANKSSQINPSSPPRRQIQSTNDLKERVETASDLSVIQPWFYRLPNQIDEEWSDPDKYSVEALLLLQKSILEKQWNLSAESTRVNNCKQVTSSGSSARRRRIDRRRLLHYRRTSHRQLSLSKQIGPEFLQNHFKGYLKGVISEGLLSHHQVVLLSKSIKDGLHLEEQKARIRKRLGCEPSEEQLASSLKISRAQLQLKFIECSLAREKLAMGNVRLVMSIAQRYDNMGAEMADLVQGGLIGLLRGIEKYDASKGFKISTYVYWWIRQGVSRALVENSRTLRLPTYLHERLSLIRNAKIRLEEKGITPSTDKIAEYLNMSQKKVRNATEAICKVVSLDREAFPSLNGLPGETMHSYTADDRLENNPWHGIDEWALKDEVNKLISTTLSEREREIIRLYFGLDNKSLTWEDISKRIGLSRERIRQVGLVALEKLKYAAKKRRLEAMLVRY